jgi:XTP/dITP diphosphohydrolase
MAGPASLVLASRNPDKLREFRRLLSPASVEVVALADGVELPPEVGDTFEANALPKARTAAAATGRAAIADDSGIEAEALQGRPGVCSARYAGEHASDGENLDKLRAEVPQGSGLRYVCVIAFVAPGEAPRVAEGRCEGRMAGTPRGERGFGYDPIFVPDGFSQTFGEMEPEAKHALSHRARAFRKLVDALF